ncbi:MAG: hypothetical protein AB9828_00340 [Sphaerochaetaceae bacterium]
MSLPFDTSLEGKKIIIRVGAMNMSIDEQSIFVFCSTNRKQMRIVYCEGARCWMLT